MCKFVCLHAITFCVGRGGDAVPFPVVWALGWNFPMIRIFARKWAAGEYQESTRRLAGRSQDSNRTLAGECQKSSRRWLRE